MPEQEPANTYLIGGAGLPVNRGPEDFPYPRAREFQISAVDWIESGENPVGVLTAPTGGGKTAIIATLAKKHDRILCLYPTNALAEDQEETLTEEFGLDVDVLTGKTLSGTGDARSQEVLSYATDPAGGDVVLTNPDVLQAILQSQYFSPGSELLRFFAHFDAAVYDEFHYYDALGASGLLMQIKVLSERGRYLGKDGENKFPRVLLPSATPSVSFVEHLERDLDLDARRIESTLVGLDVKDPGPSSDISLVYDTPNRDESHLESPPSPPQAHDAEQLAAAHESVGQSPDGVERFRYPMVVNRWERDVEDSFDLLADILSQSIDLDQSDISEGRAAIIFNSAVRSNRFQEYLQTEGTLSEVAVKDNGYDTGANKSLPDDFAILNTTSKGEVGLDFDLNRLIMVTPFTASDFVQRIGRAARHSPAVVDIFGLDDPLWPMVQSYPSFLRRVTEVLGDPNLDRNRLQDLLGLRAARALTKRLEDKDVYHTEEIWEDFGDFPRQSHWREFQEACSDAIAVATDVDDPFGPSLDRSTAKVVTLIDAALEGLDSLRGRSIQHSIQYPLGERKEQTEYDLVTALRHYAIEVVRDKTIVLGSGEPSERLGHYPGGPSEGRGIDLGHSHYAVDAGIRESVNSHISTATFRETELTQEDVERFIQVMDLGSALLPRNIETREYIFHVSKRGEITSVEDKNES